MWAKTFFPFFSCLRKQTTCSFCSSIDIQAFKPRSGCTASHCSQSFLKALKEEDTIGESVIYFTFNILAFLVVLFYPSHSMWAFLVCLFAVSFGHHWCSLCSALLRSVSHAVYLQTQVLQICKHWLWGY